MAVKKYTALLALSLLISTPISQINAGGTISEVSNISEISNVNPSYIGLVALGVVLSSGGTYWLVKNPNKKEGPFNRICRTICGSAVILSGLALIFKSKPILEEIQQTGIKVALQTLGRNVGLGKFLSYFAKKKVAFSGVEMSAVPHHDPNTGLN